MKKIIIRAAAFFLLLLFFLYGAVFYPRSAELPSGSSLEAPSENHLLGTDNLGVDIFAQVSSGFFHSMLIGISTAALAFILGGVMGVLAGFSGGRTDDVVQFLINVFLSVPQLPIMIVVGAFLGQSRLNIIIIIAMFSWAPIAKQVRAQTITLKNSAYLIMAKSYGGSLWYLFRAHMCRDIMPLLAISSIGVIGRAIVQESSLAFLGLSDPLARSWGLMISRCVSFRGIYFTEFWKWWLVSPVSALILSVLSLRMLAKALESRFLSR